MMAIGVDIDEVLFPLVQHICPFLNRKHGIHLEESQFSNYDFWENPHYKINGVQATKEQAINDFYEFISTSEFRRIQPYLGAVQAVSELTDLDFLVAITSRQKELENHTRWQLGNFFQGSFSNVVFGNHYSKNSSPSISKRQLCEDNDIKLLFEDNLTYALNVSQDIPVILFRRPWNKDVPRDARITPVDSWPQAVAAAKYIYQTRR